jgi:hypothetical protein
LLKKSRILEKEKMKPNKVINNFVVQIEHPKIGDESQKANDDDKAVISNIIEIKPKVLDCSGRIYCELVKYPTIYLRFIGLYHQKSDRLLVKLYSIFILIVLWFNFFKTFAAYNFVHGQSEGFSATLVLKIITNCWTLSVAFNSTLIYINQETDSREKAILKYVYILLEFKGNNLKQTRLFLNVLFVIAIAVGLGNSITIFVSMFGPKVLFSAFSVFLAPFQNETWAQESIPYKLLISILYSISGLHWITACAYFLMHATFVIQLLKNFDSKFSRFISDSILVSKDNAALFTVKNIGLDNENVYFETQNKVFICEHQFDDYRLWHLKLAHAVKLLDDCYKQFIGMTLLMYITIILMGLYLISDWQGNCISGLSAVLIPFWIAVAFLIIYTIIFFSSKIHALVSVYF